MRPAITPSQPPTAPQNTSTTFHGIPSCEPRAAWASSIAAEYAATSTAPRSGARVAGPSALSAINPTSAKAAMLYALRNTTWKLNVGGEVRSYTSLLIAAQNSAAATSSAGPIQSLFAPAGAGESL